MDGNARANAVGILAKDMSNCMSVPGIPGVDVMIGAGDLCRLSVDISSLRQSFDPPLLQIGVRLPIVARGGYRSLRS